MLTNDIEATHGRTSGRGTGASRRGPCSRNAVPCSTFLVPKLR